MSMMDMSAVGSGALEASFRANPVANRRADAQPRLHPYIYMWTTLAMETFEHSNEAKVKKKQGLIKRTFR